MTGRMDAPRGFEPRLTESESVVLPLDDGAARGVPLGRAGGRVKGWQTATAADCACPCRDRPRKLASPAGYLSCRAGIYICESHVRWRIFLRRMSARRAIGQNRPQRAIATGKRGAANRPGTDRGLPATTGQGPALNRAQELRKRPPSRRARQHRSPSYRVRPMPRLTLALTTAAC